VANFLPGSVATLPSPRVDYDDRVPLWVLALIAFLGLSTSRSHAAEPSQAATPEVRALVKQSSEQFAAGQYQDALRNLLAAYEKQPLPLLLFNIAQTQRKLGGRAEALDYYQRFAQAAPSSPLLPEAEAHAAALRAELAAEQAARQRADAEELARLAQARLNEAEALTAANLAARQRAEAELLSGRKEAEPKPLYKRPWLYVGLGAVVVVGVALGVGLGLGLQPPPEPSTDLPPQTVRF
jgi:tetratricopeptide (TPR) repeat protein